MQFVINKNINVTAPVHEIVNTGKGRKVVMIEGYTFSKTTVGTKYWNCTKKKGLNCEAKLRFDEKGALTFFKLTHNHKPPKYIVAGGRHIFI